MSTEDPPGVDVAAVTGWFAGHVPAARPPLTFTPIAGGRSNLTYVVTDTAGARWVLRRPPLSHVLATAHDMVREHRIVAALAGSVPVPPVAGLSADPQVNGAPFFVMQYVDGLVLRDRDAAAALDPAGRRQAADSLVDALAALHAVDPDTVGLGDLGPHTPYAGRQVRRWQAQWAASRTRELPAMDDAARLLAERAPEQTEWRVVHADCRIDNAIVGPDGTVLAVLDWELSTLGDPLADLGTLMTYWADPGDQATVMPDAPTVLPGFPTRAQVLARYAAVSGRDVSAVGYFSALAAWRLACIIEGVYARYRAGAMGEMDAGVERMAAAVPLLADRALSLLA